MAELDLGAHLRATTDRAYNNLVNDLNALDEERASGSPNAALRPAIKVVAECGVVNGTLAELLKAGSAATPSPDERAAYFASITTRAEALAELEKGTQKLYAAIDGVTADRWGETVQTMLGPMTLLTAAGFAAQHMMYHDGQLNYIHLLHGDTEMHWK
jgi:hypothetical protein